MQILQMLAWMHGLHCQHMFVTPQWTIIRPLAQQNIIGTNFTPQTFKIYNYFRQIASIFRNSIGTHLSFRKRSMISEMLVLLQKTFKFIKLHLK